MNARSVRGDYWRNASAAAQNDGNTTRICLAPAFGQQLGKVGTEIFKRHVVRIDPPGTRLCEQVGSGASAGGEG